MHKCGLSKISLTSQGRKSFLEGLIAALRTIEDNVSENDGKSVMAATVSDGRKLSQVSLIRCYELMATADADADADADAQASLSTKMTQTTEMLYALLNKILQPGDAPALDVDSVIAQLKDGLDEIAAGSSYIVGAGWKPTEKCRVTLCDGTCAASCSHRQQIGVGEEPMTAANCPPGCGHAPAHGLCAKCAPYQGKNLCVCTFCELPYRLGDTHRSLIVATVQKPTTEQTRDTATSEAEQSSLDPQGRVRECYLEKTKFTDTNGRHVWTLVSAPMSTSEVAMLAAATPGADPKAGDKYVVLKQDMCRQAWCGRCIKKFIDNKSFDDAIEGNAAAAGVNADAGVGPDNDVQYISQKVDIVGLIAAQAVATDRAEKRQISEMFADGLNTSMGMNNSTKALLTTLHKEAFKKSPQVFQLLLDAHADTVAAVQAECAATARDECAATAAPAQVGAAGRQQTLQQVEVRLLSNVAVGNRANQSFSAADGKFGPPKVRVFVETGLGMDALTKARHSVPAGGDAGTANAASKQHCAKGDANPAAEPAKLPHRAASPSPRVLRNSLLQIASAVNKDSSGSNVSNARDPQQQRVVCGKRIGVTNLDSTVQSLKRTPDATATSAKELEATSEAIHVAFPATSNPVNLEMVPHDSSILHMGPKPNCTSRTFYVRAAIAVADLEVRRTKDGTELPTRALFDGHNPESNDQNESLMTATTFNAHCPIDPVNLQFEGPGTQFVPLARHSKEEQKVVDKVNVQLLAVGKVTPRAVVHTVTSVLTRPGGLVTWLDNMLGNLAWMYNSTQGPPVKAEPVPRSTNEHTAVSSASEASGSSTVSTSVAASAAVAVSEVDKAEKASESLVFLTASEHVAASAAPSASQGSTAPSNETATQMAVSETGDSQIVADEAEEEVDKEVQNDASIDLVAASAATAPSNEMTMQMMDTESPRMGGPLTEGSSALLGSLARPQARPVDPRGRSTDGKSTRLISAGSASEVEGDFLKQVSPGTSSDDTILKRANDGANALLAVVSIDKGQLVFRENVRMSNVVSCIEDFEKQQRLNGRLYSTISKGSKFSAFLVMPDGRRTTAYMANHSSDAPNCIVTMPDRFVNLETGNGLILVTALKDIVKDEELVWDYSSKEYSYGAGGKVLIFTSATFDSEVHALLPGAYAPAPEEVRRSKRKRQGMEVILPTSFDLTPSSLHPAGATRLFVVSATKNADSFFVSAANQLDYFEVAVPSHIAGKHWTQWMVRKFTSVWMTSDTSNANSEARESYAANGTTVFSWEDVASGIIKRSVELGACRPIVAIVIAALQADLYLKTVIIDSDGEVTFDDWKRQMHNGVEHRHAHTSPAQLTLYMQCIDNDTDAGYAHYDGLQPLAVVDKGNLPPPPPSGNGPKMTQTVSQSKKKKKVDRAMTKKKKK